MKKLAIVGSHPDTRENAPFGDESFDIWVLNEAPQSEWCKRWTASFQLHKPEIYTSLNNRNNAEHWAWLQQDHGKPIYMQDADSRVPCSVRYPLEDAIALTGERYLTSTMAYACALAVLNGYDYVEFYGANLVSNTEYAYQSECFRYWVGFMRGRGIKVEMKCWPTAFASPLYGYDGEVSLGVEHYRKRVESLQGGWHSADKHLRQMLKAIDGYITKRDWRKVRDSVLRYQDAAIACGRKAGALSEAERYAGYGERPTYRQEFEFSMARSQRDGEDKRKLMYHVGGMIEYVWNVVSQTNDPRAAKQMSEFITVMGRHAYDLGALTGVFEENSSYMKLFDELAQAAGGQKSIVAVYGVNDGDN